MTDVELVMVMARRGGAPAVSSGSVGSTERRTGGTRTSEARRLRAAVALPAVMKFVVVGSSSKR